MAPALGKLLALPSQLLLALELRLPLPGITAAAGQSSGQQADQEQGSRSAQRC
jgi:hypothetical protein